MYDPFPAQQQLRAATLSIIITAILLSVASMAIIIALSIIYPARAAIITCDDRFGCSSISGQYVGIDARKHHARAKVDPNGNDVAVIGGRPAGCPHAYCGCGLRKYLGLEDARLNLAWNWARLFPRTSLRAGVVAVWHHHVALVISVVRNREAIMRDYNGGRHLSYVHERSVSGAVFVDPSSRAADASF